MHKINEKLTHSLQLAILRLGKVTFGNTALAIILVALLVHLLLLPLKLRQDKINSEIRIIHKKYQTDSDHPLTAEQRQEYVAELNQNLQVRGCILVPGCSSALLEALLSSPIRMSLQAIKDDERFAQSGILWFTDLSKRDPYFLLPTMYALLGVVEQRLRPAYSVSMIASLPKWAKIANNLKPWLSVIGRGISAGRSPAGSVLYLITSDTFNIVQQILQRRLTAEG